MTEEKDRLVAVTFKIHPRLLKEIDKIVDNIRFRSRGHIINCAIDDWLTEKQRFIHSMRENKRKKSDKPLCPACGAVITVRCEAWHNRLGRCLRHSYHTGPHYFAAKSQQQDPTFWDALQDPWTVVYFPEPEKLGRDENE